MRVIRWDRSSPFVVCHALQKGGWLTDDKKRSSVPPGVCFSDATVYGTGTAGRCGREPGRAVTAFEAGRADPLEPAGEPARDHQVHRRMAGSERARQIMS